MLHGLLHLGWNVLLACVAVALAYLLARTARVHRARGDVLFAVPLALVAVSWLLMLPNTCYLFTEVRHFFDAIEDHDLWSHAAWSSSARRALAIRSCVLGTYAVVGALSFVLAIRPVRDAAEEAGFRVRRALPFFFALVALGVYLGLVQRLNSWDVLTRPERVLANAVDAILAPRRLIAVALGGGVLWAVYEIVDIWVDGLKLRVFGASSLAR